MLIIFGQRARRFRYFNVSDRLTRNPFSYRRRRLKVASACTVIIIDIPSEIINRGSCGRRN